MQQASTKAFGSPTKNPQTVLWKRWLTVALAHVAFFLVTFVHFRGGVVISPPSFNHLEPRKKPSYFPLYWLVNRDPKTMVYEIIPKYNCVGFHPLYNSTNQGFLSLETKRFSYLPFRLSRLPQLPGWVPTMRRQRIAR